MRGRPMEKHAMSIRKTLMSLPKLILLAGAVSLAMAGACASQTLSSDPQKTAKTAKPGKRVAAHVKRPASKPRASRALAAEPVKPVAPPQRFEDSGGGGGY